MNIKNTSVLILGFISFCTYAVCNSNTEKLIANDCLNPVCVGITSAMNPVDLSLKNYQLQVQGWGKDGKKEGVAINIAKGETDSLYVCADEFLTVSLATNKREPNLDPKKKGQNAINYCGVFTLYPNDPPHITVNPINFVSIDNTDAYGYYRNVRFDISGANMVGYFVGDKYPAVCSPFSKQ